MQQSGNKGIAVAISAGCSGRVSSKEILFGLREFVNKNIGPVESTNPTVIYKQAVGLTAVYGSVALQIEAGVPITYQTEVVAAEILGLIGGLYKHMTKIFLVIAVRIDVGIGELHNLFTHTLQFMACTDGVNIANG